MDLDFGATQSFAPQMGLHDVPRANLTKEPLPRLVTLVAAAGCGKTTAAKSIVATIDGPGVWIPVDERRQSTHLFWRDVTRALVELTGPLDLRPLADLARGYDADAVDDLVRSVVTGLVNSGTRHAIGFDDVHELDDEAREGLVDLIRLAPRQTTFVVTSRQSIPWVFHAEPDASDVLAIGAEALAFDLATTQRLLESASNNDPVETATVEVVHQLTEGWPLAVGLAADAVRRSTTVAAAGITDAAGAGILDRLAGSLEPRQLQLLIDLSICSRFDESLAAAVSDVAEEIDLDGLGEQSSVIVAAGDGSDSFRLHRLVGKLLSEQLEANDPERWKSLHARAADWHRDAGDRAQEIEHRLWAEQYTLATEVLIASSDDLAVAGRLSMHLHWIRRMPDEFVAENPHLVAQLAEILALRGEVKKSRLLLSQASRSVREAHHELWVIGARFFVDWSVGNARSAAAEFETLCDAVEKHASNGEPAGFRIQQQLAGLAGLCHETLGQPEETRRLNTWLDRMASSHPTLGSDEIVNGLIARQLAVDGYMAEAAARARLSVSPGGAHDGQSILHADAHLALALVAWADGDLDAANRSLAASAHLDSGWTELFATVRVVFAAEIAAGRGRFDQADEVLNDAFSKGEEVEASEVISTFVARGAAVILAGSGRHSEARAWVTQLSGKSQESAPPAAWASCQIALGNPQIIIDRFHSSGAQLPGRPLPFVRAGLVLTQALVDVGRQSDAMRLLRSVLNVADRHRVIQPILDSPVVNELVRAEEIRDIFRSSTERSEAGKSTGTSSMDASNKRGLLPYGVKLSPREMDLLPLLPSRASNRQIAEELYVSLNTAKTHLKAIYRKLEVSSRDDAVERCRELGLLPVADPSLSD